MKLTKKLFMSIMTLALVVITLSASTFAWFTLSASNRLENVDVKVVAGTGMEISTDGSVWKNHLSLQNSIEFTDVTSAEGLTFKDMDGNAATGGTTGDEVDYYETSFYVRVNLQNAKVVLESVSGKDKATAGLLKWTSELDYDGATANETFEAGEDYGFDPLNAVKVSFTTNQTNETTAADVIYSYANTNNHGEADSSTTGFIQKYLETKEYEIPQSAQRTIPTNSYVTYGMTVTDPAQVADSNTLIKYDVVAANAEKAVIIESTDLKDATQFGTDNSLTGLDENYWYAKVTIRIWLEGWDADCINAILDGSTQLAFELKAIKLDTPQNNQQNNEGNGGN